MIVTILSIIGGVVAALILMGLIVGLFYILPPHWSGALIALFAIVTVGVFLYGLISPAQPAYPSALLPY